MEGHGFSPSVVDLNDLTDIKRSAGVPANLQSCHTALVGAYVVEGHVPADLVKKILAEKPKIAGLAVPGMPVGTRPDGHREDAVRGDRLGQGRQGHRVREAVALDRGLKRKRRVNPKAHTAFTLLGRVGLEPPTVAFNEQNRVPARRRAYYERWGTGRHRAEGNGAVTATILATVSSRVRAPASRREPRTQMVEQLAY